MNDDLEKILKKSNEILNNIYKYTGWNEDEILKDFPPKEKTLPNKSEDELIDNEPDFPESFPSQHSVVIDETHLRSLVKNPLAETPKKFSDLQLNFSREEKLAIYEHVVKVTGHQSGPEAFFDSQEWEKFTKIINAHKSERRKRRKHRKSKIGYIEEIRLLIEIHMKATFGEASSEKHEKNRKNFGKNNFQRNSLTSKDFAKDSSFRRRERSRSWNRYSRNSPRYKAYDSYGSKDRKNYHRRRSRSRSHSRSKYKEKDRKTSDSRYKKDKHSGYHKERRSRSPLYKTKNHIKDPEYSSRFSRHETERPARSHENVTKSHSHKSERTCSNSERRERKKDYSYRSRSRERKKRKRSLSSDFKEKSSSNSKEDQNNHNLHKRDKSKESHKFKKKSKKSKDNKTS